MNMDRLVGLVLMLTIACGDDGAAPADTDETGSTSMTTMSPSTTILPSTSGSPTTTSEETTDTSTGSESGSTDGSTGSGSGSSEGSSSTGVEGIAIPFHLTNFADGDPIPDADVCFLENGSCDVSDKNGDGEIVGPPDTNLTIDVSGGGTFPTRFPVRFPDEGLDAFIRTLSQIEVGFVFAVLGYEDIPTEGTVAVLALDPDGLGVAGATMSIDPDIELAPVYFDADGPDPALTATDAGLGVFIEVPAGDYEVWVEHPDYDCVPSAFAWPGTSAERSALTVEDGFLTVTFVYECTPV